MTPQAGLLRCTTLENSTKVTKKNKLSVVDAELSKDGFFEFVAVFPNGHSSTMKVDSECVYEYFGSSELEGYIEVYGANKLIHDYLIYFFSQISP